MTQELSGRIAIFTDDPGWHGRELTRAFNKHGFNVEYVSLTQCRLVLNDQDLPLYIPGFEQRLPDAVFVRGVPGGSLEEVIFYLDILHALKMLGIPVYNDAGAIERSVDKGMTSFMLHRQGLPTPPTWELREQEAALNIAEAELSAGQLIMAKPLFGSQGEGVRRLEKQSDLLWLTSSRGIYYLQRFVSCAGEGYSDIRVFVINGRAVAAMQRQGRSWLNNVAQGAKCRAISLDDDLSNLAVQAVNTLQMDYAGVDIIQDRHGKYWIIEVNSVPAWKGLQSVCEVDVAQFLVNDLLNRYLQLTSSV